MKKTKSLILCGLFAALITVGAYMKIPNPIIPFTLQTLFVFLSGLLLGGKRGAIAAAVYMLLGLIGVPVFAKGGGLWYVLEPSFGYIIGFVAASFVIGIISEKNKSFLNMLFASLVGIFIVYLFGVGYYYCIAKFYLFVDVDLAKLIFMYLPSDVVSAIFAAFIGTKLYKYTRAY